MLDAEDIYLTNFRDPNFYLSTKFDIGAMAEGLGELVDLHRGGRAHMRREAEGKV